MRPLAFLLPFFLPTLAFAGGLKEIKNCDAFAASTKMQELDQREAYANKLAPIIKENLQRAAAMPKAQKVGVCKSLQDMIGKYTDNTGNFIAGAARARSAMQKLGDTTCVQEVIKDNGDIQKFSNGFQTDYQQSCASH